jgi:alpha-2-macroglobulin
MMAQASRRFFLSVLFTFILLGCQARPELADLTAVSTPGPSPTTAILDARETPAIIPAAARPDDEIEATDTPVPQALIVQPDEGIDLDDFPADAPFTLHFNQPVQTTTTPPLRIVPATAGDFQWNEEQTSLTFVPESGFAAGRNYVITLLPGLETISGQTLADEHTWRIRTQTAPRVARRTPSISRTSERQPTFELVFNRPMEPASVTGAITVEPAVAIEATWAEEILTIAVQEPLAFDTTYQFTLADSAVDQTGLHLAADYGWNVTLEPLLEDVSWPTARDHLAPITFDFNYPLDTASFSRALRIRPAVAGKLAWHEASTSVSFMPDNRLPVDTPYTISFAGLLRDQEGQALPQPEPISFVSPPAILSALPSGEKVNPATSIRITFDRPMDEAETEAAFQIEPETTGAFAWEETTLFFRPQDGFLAENSVYTVTLAATARGAEAEQILRQPYSWSFRTGELEDVADFGHGPNAQVLDANGRRAVQFQAFSRANLNLRFELYRLSREQFLSRYASNFRGSAGWNGAPLPAISTEGTELAAAWEMETVDPLQEYANVQETLIPDEVPPGLYILNLTAGRVNDQLILILTENTLTVKEAEGQLVAWVTDINGDIVPGIEVGIYARSGDLLRSGVTDARGVFRTQLDPFAEGGPPSLEPLILMAGSGSDTTVSGLAPEWRSGSGYYEWWRPAPAAPDSTLYVFTERPIYQPGQEVFYKAIVRRDDDAVLSLFPTGTAVTARLRDARNNVVQTQELQTNDFGSVDGRFLIAEGAMLGTYHIEIVVGEDSHRQAFKVQDYRKPDYQVTVSTDADQYVVGQSIEVIVDTRYYFGQPVPDAEVTIRRYSLEEDWNNPGQYLWYEHYETMNRPLQGRTDENGRFMITYDIDDDTHLDDTLNWMSSLRQGIWGIEATVDDGSHQTVSGFAVVHIFDAAEWIELDTNSYVHAPGQPFTLDVRVATIAGDPVGNRSLTLSLRRWSVSSHDYTTVIQAETITTGANGRVALPFTIEDPGYYQLRVEGRDGLGRQIDAHSWVYAFSSRYSSWYGRAADNFTVEADRDEYAPGDIAQLVIETPVDGPALLTIERGTTRREELIQLTAPVTMIELPIQADDVPNVYVAVNVWQPQVTELDENSYNSLPDSRLLTAYTKISVPATNKILHVTITPDKAEYAPGDEATFTVKVTGRDGVPVSAEVSLGMVDEAIYALSDELAGPIYEGFYYERNSLVRSYNSLRPVRWLWQGGMGGGGGDGAATGGPRRDFPDTAAWFPALRTDFNGEVSVMVIIPDSLTTWRLTARAATADTQVGESMARILVTQEVIVRPLLPRILTAGDTIALSAMIHNYGDAPRELVVTLSVDPAQALRLDGDRRQVVTVPPGAQRIVGWQVEAMAAGEVTLTVTAESVSGAAPGDAIELPLTVQPLAVPDVATEVGQFSGQFQTTIDVPAGALEMSSVELQLSRSIAGSLLEGLVYLTGYPYGCVEQTMSKALPNAVVGRALNQLGVTNPTLQAELPGQISASIQRLYGYQHYDGGWGWWYDDPSHDYQTAWVIFGLAQVAEAGYEIDPAVIERGAAWLNEALSGMDARTRAFALYALAEAGLPNEEATLALAEDRDELAGDEFSLAGLALALFELRQTALARTLVDELAATAVVSNGSVHWQGANLDGYYYQKTMASDIRTTALALSAFSRIRPGHELEAGMVRWLMAQRRTTGWGTTNETAFAILGLTDHLLATSFNESAAATQYSVSLNGVIVATGTLGRGEPAVSLTIPRADLAAGTNTLAITQSGTGRLYYVLNGRMYLPESEIEAAGNIKVTRTYLDGETGTPIDHFVPGQLVQVRLSVRLPERGTYMLVEDRLPGGLEALNEALNTTSHNGNDYYFDYQWQALGYNNKEVHGDRVTFFITEMAAGVRTFTYFARATHAGQFTAMPAEVYAMYNLALWGRSASSQVSILATAHAPE